MDLIGSNNKTTPAVPATVFCPTSFTARSGQRIQLTIYSFDQYDDVTSEDIRIKQQQEQSRDQEARDSDKQELEEAHTHTETNGRITAQRCSVSLNISAGSGGREQTAAGSVVCLQQNQREQRRHTTNGTTAIVTFTRSAWTGSRRSLTTQRNVIYIVKLQGRIKYSIVGNCDSHFEHQVHEANIGL